MDEPNPRSRYHTFATTENRVNSQTVLWRYLTFEKFVFMLETSSLYHARLDQLGDPFEGSVTKVFANNRKSIPPEGYPGKPQMDAIFNEAIKYRSYACCWYASEIESDAMWKLYSREHAGVAIVATFGDLEKAARLPSCTDHGLLGPVSYFDFGNQDMMTGSGCGILPGYAKRKSFEHEKEVRAIVRTFEDYTNINSFMQSEEYRKSLRSQRPLGLNIEVDLKCLIQQIYISPAAPNWFDLIVKKAADRAGLNALVKKSSLLGEPIY